MRAIRTIAILLSLLSYNATVSTIPISGSLPGSIGFGKYNSSTEASILMKNEVMINTTSVDIDRSIQSDYQKQPQGDVIAEVYTDVEFVSSEFERNETVEEDGIKPAQNTTKLDAAQNNLSGWSVAWYMVSFGGLVTFFLVISCSEWLCRKRSPPYVNSIYSADLAGTMVNVNDVVIDAAPPPYSLFAPPSYESAVRMDKAHIGVDAIAVNYMENYF